MSAITVVVPSWNRRDLTERLLRKLREQTEPIAEVVVVDNGSEDGSADAARGQGARVIQMGRNTGFSGAVNRGIQETKTDLVAIVNNDVEPAPEWLARLAQATRQPRVWFASGKLLSAGEPESLDGAYDMVCRGGTAWRAGNGRRDGPVWNRMRRIRFTSFTAALFRTELFERVGPLDERFESYLEDVDFCFRSSRMGYFGLYVPGAVATHQGSATLGRWHKDIVRRMARNQLLLVAKHYPMRYMLRYCWPMFVSQMLWGVVAARHGQPLSFLRGKLEGLAKFPRIRREIAQNGGWPKGLSKVIEESEAEMYRLQKKTGFDPYWRLYFALTWLS